MVIELSHFSAEGTLNHTGNDFLHAQSPAQVEATTPTIDYSREVYGEVDLDQIEEAYERITRTFDPMFGGFGLEDKFLTTAKLSLLLRATRFPKVVQDVVGPNDCTYITGMGLHTLRRIANGAVHDHIGGGFHRYSVTRDWSLPAFEKMLIDNVLLLNLFLDAWLLSGGNEYDEFADVVTEISNYLISDRMLSEKAVSTLARQRIHTPARAILLCKTGHITCGREGNLTLLLVTNKTVKSLQRTGTSRSMATWIGNTTHMTNF